MLHHNERNLESVKDLIDPPPRATTSSPSSLSAGCTGAGIDSQPTQQMSVRDGRGEAADFTVSQSRRGTGGGGGGLALSSSLGNDSSAVTHHITCSSLIILFIWRWHTSRRLKTPNVSSSLLHRPRIYNKTGCRSVQLTFWERRQFVLRG